MRVLYNEWDEPTAAWLRELIDGRHLPSGSVDTRSIGDVRADDLRDFDQCHFFAGIGGWPLALRWSGLEGTPGIWTGSPPCQPFSLAGKGLGQADERHLAPVWLDLIRKCKPGLIFGEQVADAIRSAGQKDMHGLSDDEIRDGVPEVVRWITGRLSSIVQAVPEVLRDAVARGEPGTPANCACRSSGTGESLFSPTPREVSGAGSNRRMPPSMREKGDPLRSGSVRGPDPSQDRCRDLRNDWLALRPLDERACFQPISGPDRGRRPLHDRKYQDCYICSECAARELGRVRSGERVCRVLYKIAARDGEPAATEWLIRAIEGTLQRGWLDDLFDALEGCGYACGAAVLPACSVGAPHIRKRLFFGAVRMADAFNDGRREHGRCLDRAPQAGSGEIGERKWLWPDPSHGGASDGLAHSRRSGLEVGECLGRLPGEAYGPFKRENAPDGCDATGSVDGAGRTDTDHGFWSGADWLGCRDGKFRPVEPGTQPLLDGLPSILGRLRAIEEKTIKGIMKHGSPHTRDAKQSLLELRDYLQPKEDWAKQQSRMLFELHEAEVLHSFVLSLLSAQDCSSKCSGFKEADEAPHIRFLRSVRAHGKPFDPSYRRRPDEWGAEQPSDPLLLMSLVLARNVEAYWSEAKNAHAASGRVPILRGAGNAILPELGRKFITEFLGAIADMQDEGLTP